ncbi:ABC transporter ATP-binding protein, partial [Candidatus Microgenomates bacterium]|nr:ABC transporter ATP-binding protein [Candidatus Microgenomates bacterium]
MKPVLRVDNLSKTYGHGHTAVSAVRQVSLSLKPGDILLIIGPSGSGKTTLLSMIGTLLKPSQGTIKLDNEPLSSLPTSALTRLRLEKIGFVFQGFNLLSALTAEQNVMMPQLLAGNPRRQARARTRRMLKRLGMAKRRTYLPADLSGGEKQRVAIARALINQPLLVLADEPTANLDSKTGGQVMQILCQIACGEKRSVIIVGHDLRLRQVAKRIVTIEDGQLRG